MSSDSIESLWALFDNLFKELYHNIQGSKNQYKNANWINDRIHEQIDFSLLLGIADRYLEADQQDAYDCLTYIHKYKIIPAFWNYPTPGFGWIYTEMRFDEPHRLPEDEMEDENGYFETINSVSLARFRHVRDSVKMAKVRDRLAFPNTLPLENEEPGLLLNHATLSEAYRYLLQWWIPYSDTPQEVTCAGNR